jgi:hypothetical protein
LAKTGTLGDFVRWLPITWQRASRSVLAACYEPDVGLLYQLEQTDDGGDKHGGKYRDLEGTVEPEDRDRKPKQDKHLH